MKHHSKNDLVKLAYISPHLYVDINTVIDEMIYRANTFQIRVTCVFNEAQLIVEPGMSPLEVYWIWLAELKRLKFKWEKSMIAEVLWRERRYQLIKQSG